MTQHEGGLRSALAWSLFPLVPALLGRIYQESMGRVLLDGDPRNWSWLSWFVLTGPLWGYGFLAGAALGLPEASGLTGWRTWISRRSVWVGVGPWSGYLLGVALFFGHGFLANVVGQVMPSSPGGGFSAWMNRQPPWVNSVAFWTALVASVALVGYGWLFAAIALIRRARRLGQAWQAIGRGLTMAVGFVGSLLGSFWAATEIWRSYFFDPRIVPLFLAAATLWLVSGCAAPNSYGDVRRRDLFAAMLTAWILGLALIWRWWNRRAR